MMQLYMGSHLGKVCCLVGMYFDIVDYLQEMIGGNPVGKKLAGKFVS